MVFLVACDAGVLVTISHAHVLEGCGVKTRDVKRDGSRRGLRMDATDRDDGWIRSSSSRAMLACS
jgi:hypothetical protein